MRKLVWCGAAVMVAGAAAVYMAASHAARHPDSYWGRCFNAAAYLGLRSNPFVVMNHALVNGADAVAGQVNGGRCADQPLEPARLDKPVDGAAHDGHFGAHEPAEAVEPARHEEPADVHEPVQAEAVAPWEPIRVEVFDRHDEPPLDEFNPADGVDRVTRVESDDAITSGEIEVELLPAPAVEEECEDAPKCGLLRTMLKMAGLCHGTDIDWEAIPMPAPCADDEPQDEGVEETADQTTAETPPAVDPHEHHRHCPYMGCPYPHSRTVPVVTPVEPPKTKHVKKKVTTHKKPIPCGECVPAEKESFWKKILGCCEGEEDETPSPKGIDTMEFRPTDDHRDPPGSSPF